MLKRLLFFLLISAVSSFGALILIIPPDGGEPTFADYDKLPNGKIIINGVTYEDGSQGIPSVGGGTYYILPDLLTDAPTTNFPVGFAAYQESTNTVAPNANVPEISEWIRQGNRGDALALTGENFDASNAWFIASSGTTNGYACDVLKMAGQEAAIKLSPSLAYLEMYLVWPYNTNGFGRPFAVNRTEVWRVGWDKVTTDDQFSLYGQNLIYGTGDCYAYCVEEDEWLTSVSANPYKATFDVPDTWTDGNYTIVGHNGRGRKYGFATPRNLEVYSTSWSEDTNTWTSVLDYGATANDGVTDAGPVIDAALADAAEWDTVYFPNGTYAIETNFKENMNKIRMIGESRDGTILINSTNFSATEGHVYMAWFNASISQVKNMTLSVGDGFDSAVDSVYPYTFSASDQLLVENVLFDERPAFRYKQLLLIDTSTNVEFRDCEFIISRSPITGNFVSNLHFIDCDFRAIIDCNQLLYIGATGSDVSGCTAQDFANVDTNNFWSPYGKGRFVTYGSSDMVYYGDNQIINYEPQENYEIFTQDDVTLVGEFGSLYTYSGLGDVVDIQIDFVDIDARWDGYGNGSGLNAGVLGNMSRTDGGVLPGYVKTIDATANEVVFRVRSNRFAFTNLLDNAEDMVVEFETIVDQNSGEMVMWENNGGDFREVVSSATSNSVTVQINHNNIYGQYGIGIISGRGFGQSRNIDYWTNETAYVTEPWNVIPDSTSVAVIGVVGNQGAIYNNVFDARDPTRNTASTSVQAWGGVHSMIMDGNTVSDNETGMVLWNKNSNAESYTTNVQTLTAFNLIKDTTFTNHSAGIVQYSGFQSYNDDYFADIGYVGNVFRGNDVDAFGEALSYGYNTDEAGSNHTGMTVFDSNTFGGYATFRDEDSSNFVNQVFLSNTATGTNTIESGGTPASWYDNTFNESFSDAYSMLQIPQPVITNATSAEIWNVGTASAAWTNGTDTGTLLGQSSVTVTGLVVGANAVQLGADSGTITVLGVSDVVTTNFVATWLTSTNNQPVSLTLESSIPAEGSVLWAYSDGTPIATNSFERFDVSGLTQIIPTAGTVRSTVSGYLSRILSTAASRPTIRSVENLGHMNYTSMELSFNDSGLTSFNAGNHDATNSITWKRTFYNATGLTNAVLTNIKPNSLERTFQWTGITELDLGTWDLSGCTRMDFFLYGVTLTTASYNQMLADLREKHEAGQLLDSIVFDGGNSKYSGATAIADRSYLTNTVTGASMTITDGGLE